MLTRLTFNFVFLFLSLVIIAQNDKKNWDVNNPEGDWNWKEISFNTQEGTWMNLDVSPDGQSIVFDLLGDIYIMPSTGGKATAIRQGIAWECQPRFSPDGKKILFTSDAGGGDNIWHTDVDGSNAKQITKESFRLLNNAIWMPDGQFIIARKHFTSGRSLGAGEMWMYHVSGGTGFPLTERKNDQQDVNEPTISPDGRYVYFSEDMYPGGIFEYNKDPNSQIYIIRRYDREKGEVKNTITGAGGACRPQLSRDGKKMAFIRRVRTKSALFIHDLETGMEKMLFDGLSKDQQEAWAIFGTYTGFNWTPDDQHIVIWGKGKIWKVNTITGNATEIPFEAVVEQKVAETLRFENQAFEDEFKVKAIRHTTTSPDDKYIVFNAAGFLWIKSKHNAGLPVRLNSEAVHFEFEPSFSQDGKLLTYVTWDDDDMGSIRVRDMETGSDRAVTSHKGIYRTPSFSPNGEMIIYQKERGNMHMGYLHCKEPGIYLISMHGGDPVLVSEEGENPVFNADGSRIFYKTGGFIFGNITKSLYSMKTDGTDKKKHVDAKYAQDFAISPDNRWISWSELYKVYVAPFTITGKPVGLSHDTKAIPVAQVAADAGISIHWSADSEVLHWTLGDQYFSDTLANRFLFLAGTIDTIPPAKKEGMPLRLTLPSDKPEGIVVFRNARIITMEGDEVVLNGIVEVTGNVITFAGRSSGYRIPGNARVIDLKGKTIMPGIIDVHAHVGNFRYGLSPKKQWEYYANLAYGVTTSHDPSSNSEMIFSQSEMIKAGHMIGPRLFSTGTILYGADGDFKAVINNLEDARSAIRRTKAYGAFSVKSYNQPRREQRQQVMQAAREEGVIVVPEGGSFFFHNMSMVVDGHTGIEHNIPVAPLYGDVINLWKNTETHNTPTLIVNFGGMSGEYYWYQQTDVWTKERLMRFTPRPVIDSRSRHRTMIPEEEYINGHILTAQSCKKLQDVGVNINLGSHGQLQGLGAHWELWMFEQGGMSNIQALRAATINGARYLGMDHQIGSIKQGKLADLIVIDGNPLVNIRDTEKVLYTMVNGRLYNSETMDELTSDALKRKPFFFEKEGGSNSYPLFGHLDGEGMSKCTCGR